MDPVFEKNLERWAQICSLGKEHVADCDVAQYRFSRSRSGLMNLSAPIEGQEVFLHSPDDPLKEAEEWFRQQILKDVDTLYVYGIGLGYYYEAAKAWLHGSKKRSLVFLEDRPQVIHRFLET